MPRGYTVFYREAHVLVEDINQARELGERRKHRATIIAADLVVVDVLVTRFSIGSSITVIHLSSSARVGGLKNPLSALPWASNRAIIPRPVPSPAGWGIAVAIYLAVTHVDE
jgi:hypothetical protein